MARARTTQICNRFATIFQLLFFFLLLHLFQWRFLSSLIFFLPETPCTRRYPKKGWNLPFVSLCLTLTQHFIILFFILRMCVRDCFFGEHLVRNNCCFGFLGKFGNPFSWIFPFCYTQTLIQCKPPGFINLMFFWMEATKKFFFKETRSCNHVELQEKLWWQDKVISWQ